MLKQTPLASRALSFAFLACAAATATACVDANSDDDSVAAAPSPSLPSPSPSLPSSAPSDPLATQRVLGPTTSAPTTQDAAFAASLAGESQRAQAYLDTHVAPRLDRALRETSGLTYAQLQSEAVAATTAFEPTAALEAFFAARRPAIEAAVAHLGTTTAALGEEVRTAARGDRPAVKPQLSLDNTHPPGGVGALATCGAGHEFEPFPPYFQAGNWFLGVNSATLPVANVNGSIHSEANLIVGGTTVVGGWVRADNLPLVGAGRTQVSTTVFFSTILSELILWVPSYAGSGVALVIDIFDGPAFNTFLGSCSLPIFDAAIPVGYRIENRSRVVSHSCIVNRPASTTFLISKVRVDTYGTSAAPFGSVARAVADAQVQTIRYMNCVD
jgi:hypothetical protein